MRRAARRAALRVWHSWAGADAPADEQVAAIAEAALCAVATSPAQVDAGAAAVAQWRRTRRREDILTPDHAAVIADVALAALPYRTDL